MSSVFQPYLALEASAGSGKTFALSVRYLSLLFLGASPHKIVALTFTKKSAAEMKHRIFETLKYLESKDELEAIAVQVGKSKEAILAQRDSVMSGLLQADIKISTLDAFFGSILHQFALHVGLMPDFQTDVGGLHEEVVEEFLKQCKKASLYPSLIAFSLRENKKLGDIFELLHLLYQKKGEFDITALPSSGYVSEAKIFTILKAIKDTFENLGLGSRGLNTFEADTVDKVITKGFLQREDFGYWDYKKFANDSTNALLQELKNELNRYFNAKEAYFLGELGKLFGLYDKALLQVSKAFSQLGFDDVTNRLYTLLQNEISKDFLYFRLDGNIEHLLIDEFQDTSVIQYKILEPIIEEIRAGQGVKSFKTLFFVGDVKQSIYRFRGGAKELFGYAKEKLVLQSETLDTNYRSAKHIVEFVNATFSERIPAYLPQKVAKIKNEGFVSVVMDENVQQRSLEAIERLLEAGIKPKDIAILVYTNKDANTMKELVLGHFHTLHVRLEATLKLIEVQSVKAIIYLLKYLYFQERIYLAHFLALKGDAFDTPFEPKGLDITLAPHILVQKIIALYGLFDNSVDLLKFVEIASRFEDIEAFLFALEDLSEEAKSEDDEGLRILTVHKSKGLEFEHVILMDKFTKDNNQGNAILYAYDAIDVRGIYLNMSGREHVDEVYASAKAKEKQLSGEDRLNGLYVAFTRAKSSLFVYAKEEGSAFDVLCLEPLEVGEIASKEVISVGSQEQMSVYIPQKYGAQEVITQSVEGEPSDIKAITFGVAMHYMLEMMDSFSLASLDVAYLALKNRYTQMMDEEALSDIRTRVEKLVSCKPFLDLLEGATIYKEQPLFYQEERKQIDLLLEYNDKIVVVDYKSSSREQDKYKAQVGKYQEALKAIYGLPVEGYVCYLAREGVELVKNL